MAERDKKKTKEPSWIMRDPSIRLTNAMLRWSWGGLVRTADVVMRIRGDRAHYGIITRRARRIWKK